MKQRMRINGISDKEKPFNEETKISKTNKSLILKKRKILVDKM